MNIYQQLTSRPSQLTERIRNAIADWLAGEPADFSRLVEWLEGYSLPGTSDDESYLLLLQGLLGIRKQLDHAFTLRLARFLETQPDVNRPGDRPEEVLYNLLKLCTGFSRPPHFAEPLQAMLKREKISGSFEGTDLRAVLRDALISNQKDSALLSIWESLAEADGRGFLPGDVRDALEGIGCMPLSENEPDEPDFEELSWVLAKFAVYVGHQQQRQKIFSQCLERLVVRWGNASWDEFSHGADRYGWPDWASRLVRFNYVESPPKVPARGPFVGVFAELQRRIPEASPRERDQYRRALREINDRIVASQTDELSFAEALSEEHYLLVQLENEYSKRGQYIIADAIKVGRRDYLIEKGIIEMVG